MLSFTDLPFLSKSLPDLWFTACLLPLHWKFLVFTEKCSVASPSQKSAPKFICIFQTCLALNVPSNLVPSTFRKHFWGKGAVPGTSLCTPLEGTSQQEPDETNVPSGLGPGTLLWTYFDILGALGRDKGAPGSVSLRNLNPKDPAVLKILRVVSLLLVVNLLSHCDLLSRPPLGRRQFLDSTGILILASARSVQAVVNLGAVVKTLRGSNSLCSASP